MGELLYLPRPDQPGWRQVTREPLPDGEYDVVVVETEPAVVVEITDGPHAGRTFALGASESPIDASARYRLILEDGCFGLAVPISEHSSS